MATAPNPQDSPSTPIALALHGGAGTILKSNISPEQEVTYKQALDEALEAGWQVLTAGGTAEDAVVATVLVLENCPLFNAGHGAVFTHDGKHELDAALMLGHEQRAGAVAGVTNIKNPILAAQAVLHKSEHVLLANKGAEHFAQEQGLELVENQYYHTDFRYQQLQAALADGRVLLDHDGKADAAIAESNAPLDEKTKMGTVGAVALDQYGHLAAATSTGGMTNKKWGRVGDSPLIGAGTWADERVAISATGHGEVFIQHAVAYDVAARMKYAGASLQEAAEGTIIKHLGTVEPDSGGIIAVDALGNVCLPFNTEGMYRAWKTKHGTDTQKGVEIYKD